MSNVEDIEHHRIRKLLDERVAEIKEQTGHGVHVVTDHGQWLTVHVHELDGEGPWQKIVMPFLIIDPLGLSPESREREARRTARGAA